MAGRFLTSQKLRAVLYDAAGGMCSLCRCQLGDNWHADHMTPWVGGGHTDVSNMQALCPACNLKKGSFMFEPRRWQSEAIIDLDKQQGDNFFVEATPGAGKTQFSCHVANRMKASGDIQRIIVVSPTVAIKDGWASELHRFGLEAEEKEFTRQWPRGFDAICVSYQQVGYDAASFRKLVSEKNTLVILDEIHHCGDDASWGEAVKHAFNLAKFRLSLSGTPFRTRNDSIPFLRYVDGKAIPDFVYGYGEALQDGICRHVFFPKQGGRVEWVTPHGQMRHKTFDDDLTDSESGQRLYTALTTGEWMRDTIRDAHRKLEDLRRSDNDAAGLVLAIDHNHAKKICRMMATELGVEPDCVLSDDSEAHNRIKSFKRSARPWIVAVKMVAEGVDIPRLRVGVYATNTKTEMFFRQAVGRFVRVEDDHDDPTAHVFIPDDPTLRQYAEEMRQQRIHELEREIEDQETRDSQTREENNCDASLFMPLNSEAENSGTIAYGETFTADELRIAAEFSAGMASPETAAKILRNAGVLGKPIAEKERPVKRKSDRKKELRTTTSKLVGRIAYATGKEHSHINNTLNGMAGIQTVKDATVEQLELRVKAAMRWMTDIGEGQNVKP